MKNLQIGKSGISVPFLGMGTWAIGGGAWWGDNDDSLSVKAIQTAVEQGIRWIDTAPIYGLYHSETVVGEALKHIDRDKVVLSTKCGLEWRHETPVLHKVVDGTAVVSGATATVGRSPPAHAVAATPARTTADRANRASGRDLMPGRAATGRR